MEQELLPFRNTRVHIRFLVGLVLLDLQFSAVFCRLLFCPFFFWPLCCLSFDLWIPITSLVSLNSSYCHSGQPLSTLIWPDSWPTDGLVNILCHLQCILTCVCVRVILYFGVFEGVMTTNSTCVWKLRTYYKNVVCSCSLECGPAPKMYFYPFLRKLKGQCKRYPQIKP